MGDRLVAPGAVAAVPLPAPVQAHELPLEALGRGSVAVRTDENGLELSRLALAHLALEQGLDADARAPRIDGQRHRALDGAPAGLPQPDDDMRFQGQAGPGEARQVHGDVGFAIGTGGGQSLQGLAHRAELLVGEPELVAGEAGKVLLRRSDGYLTLDAEVGGRRTIEIAASHLDEARLLCAQRLTGGLELQLQTLGNEILHQERRLRDRRSLGVGVHLDAPRPGHGRMRQRKLGGAPAETLVGQREAGMLDAVGPREDQRHGHR